MEDQVIADMAKLKADIDAAKLKPDLRGAMIDPLLFLLQPSRACRDAAWLMWP